MLRLTLKNIWAYKARLGLSMLSILLGVSFLVGTLVISATISKVFDDLFASVFQTTDAVVRSENVTKGSFGESDQREGVRKSIVEDIKKVEGVDRAQGFIQVFNPIILDENGDRLFSGNGGPPVLGFSFDTDDVLTQWRLVDENGNSLSAKETVKFQIKDDTFLLDKSTADAKKLKVGDKVSIIFPNGPREFTLAGVVRFGSADGIAGAPGFLFNEKQITELAQRGENYDSVSVVAEDGISQEELVKRIESAFKGSGDSIEAVTGKQITEENQSEIKQGLSFFTIALTAFAFIAFFVSLIIIFNSFAITMAQRKREYALLRAVGSKSSQILRSVLLESFIVGLFASAIGVGVGIFLSIGIKSGLAALGLELPKGPLVVESSAIIIGLLSGTIATVVSAFFPALIASRISPMAALSDTTFERRLFWWPRITFLVLDGAMAVYLIVVSLTDSSGTNFKLMSIGFLLWFLFIIFVLPFLVRPFTALIGSRPLGILLFPFGGRHAFSVVGKIARRNNYRNPKRTSYTALALVIGVALVSFVTVFAASANATIDNYLKKNFVGDFIVSSTNFEPIISPSICDEIASKEFVAVSSCFKSGAVNWATSEEDKANLNNANGSFLIGFDAKSIPDLYATPFEGDLDLGENGIAVSEQFAKDHDTKLGDTIRLRAEAGQGDFEVKAILERGIPFDFATLMVDNSAYSKLSSVQTASSAIINLKDGADPEAAKKDLDKLVKGTGLAVNDQKALRDQNAAQINQLLVLIYALLALAIIIASIGIVNTMSLSILERTKELGLMRAIGVTKSQVRASIRFESVITAVMGTSIGMVFGIAGGYVLIQALKDEGFDQFAIGVPNLVSILVLSAIIGVLAGAWPAWRATKVDVLKAVSAE